MEKKEEQLLIDLTTARGVPGNEEEVREVFKEYAKDFAEDIEGTLKIKEVRYGPMYDFGQQ